MTRVNTVIAASLIIAGMIAMAGPTFGFSSLAADRGTSVTVADDQSTALLGVRETGQTPNNQNNAVVLELVNNANEDFETLNTDVSLSDPRNALEISDGFQTSLGQGETTGLELTCTGGGSGTAVINTAASASSQQLEIHDLNYSYTFDYSCTGGNPGPGGFQSVSASDIQDTTPATQEISFTMNGRLSKGGTVTIAIEGLSGVNYDDAEVIAVDGPKQKDSADFIARDGWSATIEFTPQTQLKAGDQVTISIAGINTDGFGYGIITATESETGQTGGDFFLSTGSLGFFSTSTATTTDASNTDQVTVTDSDINRMVDETGYETRLEVMELIKATDGVEYVG